MVTVPVYVVAAFHINVKSIINITGGIAGLYLLLFLPPIMVLYARKKHKDELQPLEVGENCHEMILKSNFWEWFTLVCGVIVLVFEIKGFF